MRFTHLPKPFKLPRFLLALGVLLFCQAYAQPLTISSPEAKSVSPGDFVTFVFRLEASQDLTVMVKAVTKPEWPILRQAGNVDLKAGKSKPIAVTVSVPADAVAGSQTQLILRVQNDTVQLDSSLTLSVSEFHQLEVSTISELILDQDDLGVTVSNKGNVSENLTLSIKHSGEKVFTEALELAPYSEQAFSYTPQNEGLHVIELLRGETVEASTVANVIRIGLPGPDRLLLEGSIRTSLSHTGNWSTQLELRGTLSDYYSLESTFSLPGWPRSYVQLEGDSFQLRAGKTKANPFGLNLPSGLGLSGVWFAEEHETLAAGLSWLKDDRYGIYLAGEYKDPSRQFTVGNGVIAGELYSENKFLFRFDRLQLQGRAYLFNQDFGLEGKLDYFNGIRFYTLELGAKDLLNEGLSLAGNFSLSEANEGTFTASFHLLPYIPGQSDAYLLMTAEIPTPLAGELSTGLQTGLNNSFASLRYSATLEAGWQTSSQFAVNYSSLQGLNLSLDSFWLETVADQLSLRASLRYLLEQDALEASLGADGHLNLNPFELQLSADWLSPNENLSIATNLNYFNDAWTLGLNNNLAYNYGEESGWSYALGVTADYDFAFETPESISLLAGGRNLGILRGRIKAEGIALEGIEVSIDRYRLLSDEEGEFSAELSPGEYEISIDTTSLPITYRLISPANLTSTVVLGKETLITFDVAETAVLRGRVLEDSGSETLNTPLPGVKAQLILTDPEGLKRSIISDDNGNFEVRGLVPGKATLKLSALAKGSTVIGSGEQEITLVAGEISQTMFLVESVRAKSQSFDSSSLRIRRIELSSDTVPPGSSPLVTVSLNSEVDSVKLSSAYGEIKLEPADDTWQGRLSIPLTATSGVLDFTVTAQGGEVEAEKASKVFIDPLAPAYSLTVNGPARPGERLSLEIETILYPVTIRIESDFGTVEAVELEPTHYEALLDIPQNAEDAVYNLTFILSTAEQSFTEEQTFRVLVP